MFGLGSSQKISSPVLIFDIGSGSVGAALVDITGVIPTMLWNVRRPFPFQEKLEYSRYRKGMLETFSSVAALVQKEGILKLGEKNIRDIELVFASPWHISQTVTFMFAEEKPRPVNEHLEEVNHLLKKKEKQLSKDVPGGGTALLLEKKIIEMRLNGYPTAYPMGKEARTLKTSVLLSLFGTDVEREVNHITETMFHTPPTRFHSFAGVFFSAVRDIFAKEEHFLLLDVGSEVTDVGIVRDDVLEEMISFPFGKNGVLRALSDTLQTSVTDAEMRITLYRSGKSEPKESEKIRTALSVVEHTWQEALTKAIGELSQSITVPRSVFLTADPDLGEWFRVAILECTIGSLAVGALGFNVVLLTPEHFSNLISFSPGILSDSFLDIEALFAHKNVHRTVVE